MVVQTCVRFDVVYVSVEYGYVKGTGVRKQDMGRPQL